MAFSKKLLAGLGMLGAAALVMTGCAAAPEAPSATGGAGGSETTTDAKNFTACMVSDEGGFDDKSFNELAFNGLKQAESELGVKTISAESKAADAYNSNMQTMISKGCNIIIPVGFNLTNATETFAQKNPEVKFAGVDFQLKKPTDNFLSLQYDVAQSAYLAGYAAAAYSKTGVVGTYGGMSIPTVTIFMDGFAKGIDRYNQDAGKNVKLIGWNVEEQQGSFVGDFSDNNKAKTIAEGFIGQGADVILPVGGPLYQGAAEAVKDANNGGVIIGVDSDLATKEPKYKDIILTSIEKGLDVSVVEAVKEAVDGTFKGGVYVGTLKNGGTKLAPFGAFESKLPAGTIEKLDQLKKDIEEGKITDLSKSSPKSA